MSASAPHHAKSAEPIPSLEWMAAVAVALLAAGAALRTLHPGLGPTLEVIQFQAAALSGGLPPAPGSPLLLLLSTILLRLSLPLDPAFTVNLLSIIAAAGAIGLTHLTTYRLTSSTSISTFSTLALAFSPRFWQAASVAGDASWGALVTAGLLYMMISWFYRRQPRFVLGAIVIWSLGLSINVVSWALLPLWGMLLLSPQPDPGVSRRMMAAGIVVLLVGLLPLLAIPLRLDSVVCVSCPGTSVASWLSYLTGDPHFGVPLGTIIERIPQLTADWARQYYLWGMLLIVVGGWELLKRRALLASIPALTVLLISGGALLLDAPDWLGATLPAAAACAPLLGYGVLRFWQILEPQVDELTMNERERLATATQVGFVGAFVVLLLAGLLLSLPQVDMSGDGVLNREGRVLLAASQGETVVLMPTDEGTPEGLRGWALVALAGVDDRVSVYPAANDEPPGESVMTVIVLDVTDPRAADWVLLPLCTGDRTVIGYRAVGVIEDGEVRPWPSLLDHWDEIAPYASSPGEAMICPPS